MRETARFHLARGRSVVRLNLRGAGTSRYTANGYYHAGRAEDVQDVLDGLDNALAEAGTFLIGFSLGGNILLNLFRRRNHLHSIVGMATVSAPIEPREASERLMHSRNALYHRFILESVKCDVLASKALPEFERRKIKRAPSIFAFDDEWLAPRNGFLGAVDYYERTAGARFLEYATVPTLLLHASNDPWIPVESYLHVRSRKLPNVEVVIARSGGHVGFHERGHAETWHDRTIDAFIQHLFGQPRATRPPGKPLSSRANGYAWK